MSKKDIIAIILISPVVISALIIIGLGFYELCIKIPYGFVIVGSLIAFTIGAAMLQMED